MKEWLVLGIFEEDAEPPPAGARNGPGTDQYGLIADKDLTGSPGELTGASRATGPASQRRPAGGFDGPRRRFDSGAAYAAGFTFAKRLAGKRRDAVAVVLPPADHPLRCASALIEGAVAGTRGPGVRKTESARHAFESLSLVVGGDHADLEAVELEKRLCPWRDHRQRR